MRDDRRTGRHDSVVLGFDATPIAQALNDLHGDLRAVAPGTVLLGRELALSMSYASYGWSGATASMTAKVVAPQTNPAPLLTLDMHMSVTLGGATQTFGATQDLPLHSEQIGMDHSRGPQDDIEAKVRTCAWDKLHTVHRVVAVQGYRPVSAHAELQGVRT